MKYIIKTNIMLLTRQKILLAYLYLFWKWCSRLHLTKSLFLFCQENENNIYDFHPYKRWPFSELIFLDLRKLDEKGIIKNGEFLVNISDTEKVKEIINKLDSQLIYLLQSIIIKYWKTTDNQLMEKVYEKFPYFAINNPQKKWKYNQYDPRLSKENTKPIISTIWYEWITIDKYINRLIENNITILIDVRKNPNSMKYGFSTTRLKYICEKRSIKYLLISELWIESLKRKKLETYEDYKRLFKWYRQTLPWKEKYINDISNILKNQERIALTCFEANEKYCHRTEVANYLYNFTNWEYELKHI